MNCPFCDIITKNTERLLLESPHTFVVLSNPRLVPGHLLVIPKPHVEKLSELNDEERKDLFDTAIKVEEKILEVLASGCDVSQHYRPFIEQNRLKINHVHIHLRPRELEDELFQKVQKHEKELFKDLEKEEFEKYKKLLTD